MADAPPAASVMTRASGPASFAYIVEDGVAREVDHDRAHEQKRNRNSLLWVHLHGSDEFCDAWLASLPDIPHPVRSALTATETRPRCDAIDDGALVNLRGLGDARMDSADPLVSIRMWLQRGRVVSVTRRAMSAIAPLRVDLSEGRVHDPGDLVAVLATEISTQLDTVIAEIGDQLDDTETALSAERAFEMRRTTAKIRAQAIGFRRFVAPERIALRALAELPTSWIDDRDRVDLKDAADRFARMTEELEAIRERAALMHEQLTDLRAEQIEGRTLLLSMVALIFLPLTFITGLIGMNVEGIPYATEPWAFWAIVGFCVLTGGGVMAWFIRAHWLRR